MWKYSDRIALGPHRNEHGSNLRGPRGHRRPARGLPDRTHSGAATRRRTLGERLTGMSHWLDAGTCERRQPRPSRVGSDAGRTPGRRRRHKHVVSQSRACLGGPSDRDTDEPRHSLQLRRRGPDRRRHGHDSRTWRALRVRDGRRSGPLRERDLPRLLGSTSWRRTGSTPRM